MVKIVPCAFHTSFLILRSGQGNYHYTEIKIKNNKRVCVVFVVYFILKRHGKYNALEQ